MGTVRSLGADAIAQRSATDQLLHRMVCIYAHLWQGARWDPSTLPMQGPAILACNHLSVLDPILLIASNRRVLSFLVAQEYYDLGWLRPLLERTACIPVRRDGHDLKALRQALRHLRAGRALGIFPEGGIDQDEMQAGLAWLVHRSGAPVVPARVNGVQQRRSDWATWTQRQRPRLRYGVPLHFHGDASAEEILGATRSAIATLA